MRKSWQANHIDRSAGKTFHRLLFDIVICIFPPKIEYLIDIEAILLIVLINLFDRNLLEKISWFVIQIPIFEVRSDGIDNLTSSLIMAGLYKIPEVRGLFQK